MKPWRYQPAADLDQPLIERLRRFPREPDMLVYGVRSLAALLIRGWLRVYHRFDVLGRKHFPEDRSFVMVANHASHLDALCLVAALPLRRLHRAFPAAAQDYFFQQLPRMWLAAVVINALPFGRQTHIRQSLDLCSHLLANPGNILIVFPEGTRSEDGAIGRFRPGIGVLLAGSNVPVLPCALIGTFRAWPRQRAVPRPGRVRLVIDPPRAYGELAPGKEAAHRVAEDLEQAVRKLKTRHEAD